MNRLPKRIGYLIKLIVVSEIIYYIANVTLFGRKFAMIDMLKCFSGITMLNGALWTVTAMLIIQIVYYLGYRLTECKNPIVLSAIGCSLYILLTALRLRGKGGAWEMQSCCSFVVGSIIAKYEDCFIKKLKKINILQFVYALIVFFTAFLMPYLAEKILGNDYTIIRVVFGTIASCAFVFVLLFVVSKLKIKNFFLVLCGSLFTEIYLWHGLVLDIIKLSCPSMFIKTSNYIKTSVISIVLVLMCALLAKEMQEKGKFFRAFLRKWKSAQ